MLCVGRVPKYQHADGVGVNARIKLKIVSAEFRCAAVCQVRKCFCKQYSVIQNCGSQALGRCCALEECHNISMLAACESALGNRKWGVRQCLEDALI